MILGQPDATSEGRAVGGRGPANGLHLPTGWIIYDGALYVADAWHHRILVWSSVPDRSDAPPDAAIGQDGLTATQPDRGGEPTVNTLYWPYGLGGAAGHLSVTDTGNRRALGWALSEGGPVGRPPDVLLGQTDAMSREVNHGADAAADSFRCPQDVAGTDERLVVADTANNRVLIWDEVPTTAGGPAQRVLAQPDFASNSVMPGDLGPPTRTGAP